MNSISRRVPQGLIAAQHPGSHTRQTHNIGYGRIPQSPVCQLVLHGQSFSSRRLLRCVVQPDAREPFSREGGRQRLPPTRSTSAKRQLHIVEQELPRIDLLTAPRSYICAPSHSPTSRARRNPPPALRLPISQGRRHPPLSGHGVATQRDIRVELATSCSGRRASRACPVLRRRAAVGVARLLGDEPSGRGPP